MSNDKFKRGDEVRIMVGGPHENFLRPATVSQVLEHNGKVVVYLDDQDEDEFVYSPNELEKIKTNPDVQNAKALYRVWALLDQWESATELSSGAPSIITQAFAAEVRKAIEG